MAAFKKVVLLVAGTAMQRFGEKLQDEQEVLTYLADMLIDTYAAESALLRARRTAAQDAGKNAALQADAATGLRARSRGPDRTGGAGMPGRNG